MSCCEGNHESGEQAPERYRRRRPRCSGSFRSSCRRPARRGARRQDEAGDRHCAVGPGPVRAVREEPREEGPRDGIFAGRDRRSGLDGHCVRRIAHDGVLQWRAKGCGADIEWVLNGVGAAVQLPPQQ